MKKIFFLAFMALTISASAQTQRIDPNVNPGICAPVAIGTVQPRVAYIKERPTSSAWPTPVVAYVRMIAADGLPTDVPVAGQIVNTPGTWAGITFPAVMACKVEVKAVAGPDGKALVDATGNVITVTNIYF